MLEVKAHEQIKTEEEIRANTTNDCFYCTNGGKDCVICVWR